MFLLKIIAFIVTTAILSIALFCMMLGRWLLTPMLGNATDDMLAMLEEIRSLWKSLGEFIIEELQ